MSQDTTPVNAIAVKRLSSSSVKPVGGGVRTGLRAGITVNKAKTG